MLTLEIPIEQILTFMFVLVRVSALLFAVPFLDSRNVPTLVKVGLAVAIAIVLLPRVPFVPLALLDRPLQLIIGLIVEVAVGLIVAMIVQLFFTGIQLAGQTMGHQMGMSIANVIDPASSLQVPLLAQFLNIFAMLLFLTFNVHFYFIKMLAASFTRIPLWSFRLDHHLFDLMVGLAGNAFVVAVQFGAPVIVTLLLTSVALGLVARTVPQMQIFIVAMPLKIVVGLFFMGLSLSFGANYLHTGMITLGKTIQSLILWLG